MKHSRQEGKTSKSKVNLEENYKEISKNFVTVITKEQSNINLAQPSFLKNVNSVTKYGMEEDGI